METVQELRCQGIPFQGDEGNDNFSGILLLRGKGDPEVAKRVLNNTDPKLKKCTHDQYQNELIDIMAKHVLRLRLSEIHQSIFFGLMTDEYTDLSNKKQVSISLRWVNSKEFKVHDNFIGFYEVDNIQNITIVQAITDALIRLNLPISRCRGQTYDGASNMMGKKSGVAAEIINLGPKALATHCHWHPLNLSVKSATEQCQLLRDTLDTVRKICILVKYSPKRKKLLENIQGNIEGEYQTTALDKLCPTRLTVRADCYRKIVTFYDALFSLWDHFLETGKMDRELRSRIGVAKAQMTTFSFFFGLQLGYRIYIITDNLSKALQEKKMSAISGQRLVRATLSAIEAMQNDNLSIVLWARLKES